MRQIKLKVNKLLSVTDVIMCSMCLGSPCITCYIKTQGSCKKSLHHGSWAYSILMFVFHKLYKGLISTRTTCKQCTGRIFAIIMHDVDISSMYKLNIMRGVVLVIACQ